MGREVHVAIGLSAIVALGFGLRLGPGAYVDLWLDEVLTLTYSERPFLALWLAPDDPTPPLYYSLHNAFVGWTHSPVVARSISIAAGVAAIPVVFLIGRRIGGAAVGLAMALFLAVFDAHIQRSQDARAYALLFLAVALGCLAFVHIVERWRRGGSAWGAQTGLVAACGVATLTHFTAAFWVAGVHVALAFVAFSSPDRSRACRDWLAGALATALVLAPAVWMALGSVGLYRDRVHLSAAGAIAQIFKPVLGYSGWAGASLAQLLLIVAFGAGALLARRSRPLLWLCIAMTLALSALWLTGLIKPVLNTKTVQFWLIVPLAFWALSCTARPGLSRNVLTGLVAIVLLAQHVAAERAGTGRYDWGDSAAWIEQRANSDDAVLLCQFFTYIPFRYYLGQDVDTPIFGVVTPDLAFAYPAPAREERPWIESGFGSTVRFNAARIERDALVQRLSATPRIWIVRGHCDGQRADQLNRFLSGFQGDRRTVWRGRGIEIDVLERQP